MYKLKKRNRNRGFSVAQLNVNGCSFVPLQLLDYCRKERIDVLLLQEVRVTGESIEGFEDLKDRSVFSCKGGPAQAAIIVLNKDIEVVAISGVMNHYFAVASLRRGKSKPVVFISSYFQYSIQTSVFTDYLGKILERIGERVVIGADVNAHSPRWFSRPGNNSGGARGKWVERLIEDKLLRVHNRGGCCDTYYKRGMGSSNIDVTLTRGSEMEEAILGWDVIEDVTDSDHRLIRFKVRSTFGGDSGEVDRRRYVVKKADWDLFRMVLARNILEREDEMTGEVEVASEVFVTSIQRAMEASMPKSRRMGRSKPPWWTEENEETKKRVLAFRRGKDWKGEDRDEYRKLRNEHMYGVRKAKWSSWRRFADTANEDVWGPVYRWANKGSAASRVPNSVVKPDGSMTLSALETAQCLLGALVSADSAVPTFERPRVENLEIEVTEEEVRKAIWRMAPNKAPGLDGITAGVLRKSWGIVGPLFTRLLRRCLRTSHFPDRWKVADVIVIKKGREKDPSIPKSYRPVSLLSVPSKVLERLIVDRLEEETEEKLSVEQHGFTRHRSTVTAMKECFEWVNGRREKMVVGIFLDISGAFDNLDWRMLIEDLVDLGVSDGIRSIIQDYLRGRKAVLTVEKSTSSAVLTRGCPQGSQLGPILWKRSMDAALREQRDDRVKLVAYADDLAVLTAGTNIEVIKNRVYGQIQALMRWAAERGLQFSATKTQVMSLKGGLKPGFLFPFGEDLVRSVSPIKYLGVMVDYKRNFWAHLEMVAGKSEGMYDRLRSATSANWGVRQRTSEVIYKAVFLPRVCYAAEIWDSAVRTKKAIALLGSKQRKPLLAITGAYRTTATDALQVVAGQLPLDLEVSWSATVQRLRSGEIEETEANKVREEIMDRWQGRWNNSEKGRWTYSIMPSVRRRVELPLELDHYTTQFLTGHGDFNAKLHYLGLTGSPLCRCTLARETVEHALFYCVKNEDFRIGLKRVICESGMNWPCTPDVFMRTRKNFEALRKFARSSLRLKEDQAKVMRNIRRQF